MTERRKTTGKDIIGPDLFVNDYIQSSSVNPVASSAPSAHRGVTFKDPQINVTEEVTNAAQPPPTQLLPPSIPAAVPTSTLSTTQVPQITQPASVPTAPTQTESVPAASVPLQQHTLRLPAVHQPNPQVPSQHHNLTSVANQRQPLSAAASPFTPRPPVNPHRLSFDPSPLPAVYPHVATTPFA